MKQKRKFIIFTAFVVVAVSVFCAFIMKKTEQQTLTVTDADGITYVAVYDQNNNAYAGVTDADGNMYAAMIDANGVVLKDQPVYVVGDYTGTFPYNDTTRTDDIHINQSNNEDIDFNDIETKTSETSEPENSGKTTAPQNQNNKETTKSSNVPSTTTDNQTNNDKFMSEDFIKLFNSGLFMMKFSTDDPDIPGDVVLAMKDKNIYMDTSIEGMSCQVIFQPETKTGYIIIPQMRVYCILPEDLAMDMKTTSFSMPEISEAQEKNVSTISIDGKDCVCEEFKYADGEERSFYYYNGNLIRMVIFEGGETSVYNIKEISSDVDNSYFEIPKGYMKVNLSWLQTQSG